MKTFYKVIIGFSIGVCLIFAGISLGGLNQMQITNIFENGLIWDANPISDIHYQADRKVDKLKIDLFNANVNFEESQDEYVRVNATRIYEGFDVKQNGDELEIKQTHYWKFFQHYDKAEITIYLPSEYIINETEVNVRAGNVSYDNLFGKDIEIHVGAGNLNLDGVSCENLTVKVGMGNANIDGASFNEDLKIKVGMGIINIDVNGHQREYSYKMKVGLGSARIGDEKVNGIGKSESHYGTTSKTIDADCGMGSIKVRMED